MDLRAGLFKIYYSASVDILLAFRNGGSLLVNGAGDFFGKY